MRILSTNPAVIPRHRLGSTDFEVTRAEILQSLQQDHYDVVVVTNLLETPSVQVLEWIRNDSWVKEYRSELVYIVLTDQVLKPTKQILPIPETSGPDRVESALSRFLPKEEGSGTGEHPRVYMRELVALTEKAVKAQTITAQEITGLRREFTDLRSNLKEEMKEVKVQIEDFRTYADKQRDQILAKFGDGPWSKVFEGLKWITDHPLVAMGIFLACLTLIGCVVVGLNALKPEKIDFLRSLTTTPKGN